MREYTKKTENQSRTLDSNPRASRQAPISDILQTYKNRTLGVQTVQRESIEDEDLLQGKFENIDQNVVQMQQYVRGIKRGERLNMDTFETIKETTKEIMSRETELLKRKFAAETFGDYKTVNEWLDGFVGMSTTKYEEGKKHYYSPVGYIVTIDDANKVIGNYASDGNTSRMAYKSDIGDDINEDILNSIVLKLNPTAEIGTLDRSQKINLIKDNYNAEKIREALVEFYKNPAKTKSPLGEGINPQGLNTASLASKDKEDEYTESLLWVTDVDVLGAYYNDNDNSPKAGWDKSEDTYRESAVEVNTLLDKDRLFKFNTDGVLQGKFEADQREGINDNELLQLESKPVSIDKSSVQSKKRNNTGLPDNLKTGIENISGYSMDDVKVTLNSDKPAQLNALAYTQGAEVYVAPGQEKYLPHEAWHVVQQKQGRVQPTIQLQGINVNDNEMLEKEADVMGVKSIQMKEPNNIEREGCHLENTAQLLKIAGNPLEIKEEEYFISTQDLSIKYTALSAGCMAVTVSFSTGGGAGVHMAMLEQGTGQWTAFYDAISDKTITSLFLNCDSWEGNEDWRVKKGESSPKSTAQLVLNEGKDLDNLSTEGWKEDKESIKEWFKAKLGVYPSFNGGGTPTYTFP